MSGFGALGKLAMSLGRELFGSAARGTKGIVKLAEESGVKMDALQDSSPEELMSVMDRAARQRLIDPRFANSINIQIAKDAQEAVPDNVASFADAQSDQMVSKIKGVLEGMPYTMNLPYEIGKKLNSEGKLPLPIGTNMMPPSGKGRPEDVYKISGYKADPNNPNIYGYEITSPEGDVSYIGVSDPKMGIKEKRPDMVAGWKAALGPQGSERLDYTQPDWQRTETPKIVRAPEDQNAIDQEYNDLFGALPTAPAMPTLKAQDAANKLSKQFGVNFDVSNHPTSYGNSTYVSGRIAGPKGTFVDVGFRLSDHSTGDARKATDDFLTIIDDGEVTSETLVAEVQGQLDRALPKMQKISGDREAKTIAQSDALSRWSELSGDERGEIAVKFNETRPTGFNNVPWKNLTKQQKADFAVDGPLSPAALGGPK